MKRKSYMNKKTQIINSNNGDENTIKNLEEKSYLAKFTPDGRLMAGRIVFEYGEVVYMFNLTKFILVFLFLRNLINIKMQVQVFYIYFYFHS